MASLSFAKNNTESTEFFPNFSKIRITTENQFELELKNLTETIAKTFNIDRVGIWFIDKSKSICKSKSLYDLDTNSHSDNKFLAISTFPEYLKLLNDKKFINSSNTSRDPYLKDFWDRYLKDLNIYSILNSSIWVGGELVGFVTCAVQNRCKTFSDEEILATTNAADAISNWIYQLSSICAATEDKNHIAFKELIKKFIQTCSQTTFLSYDDCITQIIDTAKRISKAESITTYLIEEGNVNYFSSNKKNKPQGSYKTIIEAFKLLKTSKFIWIPDPRKPLIGVPNSFFELLKGLSGPCLISTVGSLKSRECPTNIGIVIYNFEKFESEFNKDFLELAIYTGEALRVISDFSKTTSLFKESLEISRAAFQNSSVGMVIINRDGNILRANPTAKSILGATSLHLSQKKITSYFSDKRIIAKFNKNLSSVGGKTFQAQTKLTNSFNQVKSVIVNLSPIILHQEHRSFSILQIIDVTKRYKAVKQLAIQKAFFRAVIDASPNFVFAKDREGKFLLANKAVAEAYGTTEEDLVGKKDSDFNQNKEQVEKFLKDDKYVLDTDSELIIKDEAVTDSNGNQRFLYTVKKPLHFGNSKSKLVLGVSTDITPLKQAEQEYKEWHQKIEQTEKLESLGLLASGIAHDFNNILQGVIGNSSLASQLIENDSPAKHLIMKTLDSAEKAAEITSQLLSYSGKAHQELNYHDLTEVVKETSQLVERMSIKKATLVYNITTTPLPVLADLPKLRQVILNLITNAFESIEHKKGEILIKTFSLLPTENDLNAYAVVQVKDNGTGIAPELLERIFEPFYSTKLTGRGIGLAAVHGIIKSHNGLLKVQSQVGVGSEFSVLLPLETNQNNILQNKSVTSRITDKRYSNSTVLLIEDEDISREVCESMLRFFNIEVVAAKNGLEGIKLFHSGKYNFSAIILDLTMPKVDGIDVYNDIRKIDPSIPILFSSGCNENQISLNLSESQNTFFIQKPFTVHQFKDALEKLDFTEVKII